MPNDFISNMMESYRNLLPMLEGSALSVSQGRGLVLGNGAITGDAAIKQLQLTLDDAISKLLQLSNDPRSTKEQSDEFVSMRDRAVAARALV